MRKIITLLSLFFFTNCAGFSQTVDVGYKADCLESYANIVYENLLLIIDSTDLNELIKENVKFRVLVKFNTDTGYPKEILIIDSLNVLSNEKKEEYKSLLFKTKFYLCHNEHDVHKKTAREVGMTGIDAGRFSTWWSKKHRANNALKQKVQ